jgi:hypothetical protein
VIIFPIACAVAGAAVNDRTKFSFIAAGALILLGVAGCARYYGWSKGNMKDVAAYVTELTRSEKLLLIRPANVAPMINYYYSGDAVQIDEAYLDTQLGEVVDTASAFVYVSLEVPNPIREYMDGHFAKKSERVFPGIAHMGIIVGAYSQKPDTEPDTEE